MCSFVCRRVFAWTRQRDRRCEPCLLPPLPCPQPRWTLLQSALVVERRDKRSIPSALVPRFQTRMNTMFLHIARFSPSMSFVNNKTDIPTAHRISKHCRVEQDKHACHRCSHRPRILHPLLQDKQSRRGRVRTVFMNSQHTENSHATGSTKSTSESSRHTTFWESIISMCTLHLQS